MRLIASLPWYDLPPARTGLNAFWRVLRSELEPISALPLPDALERTMPLMEQWFHAGLLLSQCCGPDLFTPAARYLVPVARPVFMNLDCAPGDYYSHIVTIHRSLPARPRLVVNSPSSRSGCAALYEWLRRQQIEPGAVTISGAHATSLERLRNGDADVAAIDAHSWPLLNTPGLRIIGRSAPAPSPPFVMHQGAPFSRAQLQHALHTAIAGAGEAIGISGLVSSGREDYTAVHAEPAKRQTGCAELA
ncbi:PhnD/SsuA/transferrin family substrate-binding protein [Oceanimonas pelagia]|uniref:PhnD/SsuA/transferrin family substrate-binding protein n=1 Tax=Oceanimonas pelagia TaxID=3028314 RepID=A0AA50KSE8_9GAMM|nr:PhnD/SsuA/transferrin family substrate-binding protein [Oceanimonas pelagia]WMC12137.1 PhnD/SsuA/transferrin family substrate-binding protein [Oceanimonas pelagia]